MHARKYTTTPLKRDILIVNHAKKDLHELLQRPYTSKHNVSATFTFKFIGAALLRSKAVELRCYWQHGAGAFNCHSRVLAPFVNRRFPNTYQCSPMPIAARDLGHTVPQSTPGCFLVMPDQLHNDCGKRNVLPPGCSCKRTDTGRNCF